MGGQGVHVPKMDSSVRLYRMFALVAAATNLARMLLMPLVMVALDAQKLCYLALTFITVVSALCLLRVRVPNRTQLEAAKEDLEAQAEEDMRRADGTINNSLYASYFSGFFTDSLVIVTSGPSSSFFSDYLPSTLPLYLPWLFLASFAAPYVFLFLSFRDPWLRERFFKRVAGFWAALTYLVHGEQAEGEQQKNMKRVRLCVCLCVCESLPLSS